MSRGGRLWSGFEPGHEPLFGAGWKLNFGCRLCISRKRQRALADLFLAACADQQMRLDWLRFVRRQCASRVKRQIGIGNVQFVVHAVIAFLIAVNPARIRVFTVPSGERVRSAISVWLKPWK